LARDHWLCRCRAGIFGRLRLPVSSGTRVDHGRIEPGFKLSACGAITSDALKKRIRQTYQRNSKPQPPRARPRPKFPLDAPKTWRRTIVEDAHVQPSGLIWGGGLLREAKAV